MAENKKLSLSIHEAHLFHPQPVRVKRIVKAKLCDKLLVVKEPVGNKQSKHENPKIIEIYSHRHDCQLKLLYTFIEYDCITFASWLDSNFFLTVSKEQTINIYCVTKGLKVFTTLTDYGPINCAKYDDKEKFLITGTEYGIVGVYQVVGKKPRIEPLNNLVKINHGISSIDYYMNARQEPATKPQNRSRVQPGKRKRSASSDESEVDEAVEQDELKLGNVDITIYGAAGSEIVVWDYHKRSIVDTIRTDEKSSITALVVLENGDIAAGDSEGLINFFDSVSLTRQQALKVLNSGIVCIAKDQQEKTLLLSGYDCKIAILQKDLLDSKRFSLFESIENHTCCINSVEYLSTGPKDFLSGSDDGFIVRSVRKKGKLNKTRIFHDYSTRTRFSHREFLSQYDRSLNIWNLPKHHRRTTTREHNGESNKGLPIKSIELKTKMFIHASTFNQDWICYSTKRNVFIFKRFNDGKIVQFNLTKKIYDCCSLELCANGKSLAIGANRRLFFVNLDEVVDDPKNTEEDSKISKLGFICEFKLKRSVRRLLFIEKANLMVALCGMIDTLVVFRVGSKKGRPDIRIATKFIPSHSSGFSLIAHYNGEPRLYVLTLNNHLIKLDLTSDTLDKEKVKIGVDDIQRIDGLPADARIVGMAVISEDYCILHDDETLYKVDMNSYKVVNRRSDYKHIVQIDNSCFTKSNRIALVELTPEDYASRLTSIICQTNRKFGCN